MPDFIVECIAKVPANLTVTADNLDAAVAQVVHEKNVADVLAAVEDPELGEVSINRTTEVVPEVEPGTEQAQIAPPAQEQSQAQPPQ
jgi:hypothetical protein